MITANNQGEFTIQRPSKGTWIERFLLFVWLICSSSTYLYVHLYGLPLPFGDDWVHFGQIVGRDPITFEWLWSLYNEHRFPLSKLLNVAIIRASSNSFRAGMILDVLVLSAVALAMLIVFRKVRGQSSVSDIIIPVCLLSIGQHENLLWSNQLQFVFTTAITCIAMILVCNVTSPPHFSVLFTISILLVLMPLFGSAGLILQLPLLLWLLATMKFYSSNFTKSQLCFLISLFLINLAITAFYFVDYHPVFLYWSYRPSDIFRASLEFLTTIFGPSGMSSWKIKSAISAFLVLSALTLLARTFKMESKERLRSSGLFATLIGFILMMVTVAIGRSGGGPGYGAAHRYTTLTVPMLFTIYAAFIIYGGKLLKSAMPWALLAVTILAIPMNTRIAVHYGKSRKLLYANLLGDIDSGLPIEAISTRNLEVIYPVYKPYVPGLFADLQKYKIGPFAEFNQSGEISNLREIEVSLNSGYGSSGSHPNHISFAFEQPQFLIGFRPTFVLQNRVGKPPTLLMSWNNGSTNHKRTIRILSDSSPNEQTLSMWPYDAINRIELIASPNDTLRIVKMTLLVK